MRKTVLAAMAATGLAIVGIGGAALAATDGPDRSPASVLSTADPTAPAATPPAPAATPPAGADETADPANTPDGEPGTPVSGARAGELAVRRVGGGQVTEMELEREHGRTVWKIEVYAGTTEYDILVDAETGAIVRVRQDH